MSKDAKIAFTPVLLDIPNGDVTEELAGSILATTAPAQKAGVEVTVGGNLGGVLSKSPTESSELAVQAAPARRHRGGVGTARPETGRPSHAHHRPTRGLTLGERRGTHAAGEVRVLAGRVVDRRAEGGTDTPHYQLQVDGGGVDFRVAVNVLSKQHPSELLYLADESFQHPVAQELATRPDGFTPLPSTPGGPAPDFIRANLFDRTKMRPTRRRGSTPSASGGARAGHTRQGVRVRSRQRDPRHPHEPGDPEAPDDTVRIVAALVNPVGPAPEAETVTVVNASSGDIDLAGWSILDREKRRLMLDAGTLPAGDADPSPTPRPRPPPKDEA